MDADAPSQSERRIRHIEGLLEQQRKIAAELEQVDHETRLEVEEGLRHERAVTQMIAQSEPTTPPEYQNTLPSTYKLLSLTVLEQLLTVIFQPSLLAPTATRMRA